MKILQLTSHFSPNVGGVETHLNDLVDALRKRGHKVFVLTYRPLSIKTRWKTYEKEKNLEIFRIPWLPGFFYKLVPYPILEFLYLFPGLFLTTPFMVLVKKPNVIHAHGIIAGAVGVIWGRLFRIRTVVSTHSIYHFPDRGLYRTFVKWIFDNADFSLGLSKQAVREITSLGIPQRKVGTFTYWINLQRFKPIKNAKEKLDWQRKFVVLFVGRLVEEKGVPELLSSFKKWKNEITLAVAGTGPLEKEILKIDKPNLIYLGKLGQKDLPIYYSGADVLIVPSVHEEGFGRVILEALACGTPVIGAKRGAIPEAMDETVGKFIAITPKNIKKIVEFFYKNPSELRKLAASSQKFAQRRYSEKNVEKIIKAYKQT